jgi:hypothetical protein
MKKTLCCILLLAALGMAPADLLADQVIFFDNFASGPSSYWQPKKGNWVASGGVYYDANPVVYPNPSEWTYLNLPQTLTDFTVSVDINMISDGGLMLRCDENSQNYVVLITGGFDHKGTGLYWHKIKDGYNDSVVYSPVSDLFVNGVSNAKITVKVQGTTYSAYVNDNPTPVTTFTWDGVASGKFGLYSWSGQTFDNVKISIPGSSLPPISMLLLE